ncbi:MAG: hypothetical protein KY468_08275 [Armatimonadetes bacterium]|nr:hypothetical protein [Armatimonadota bacterium]
MKQYPVAYADQEIEGCAPAIITQLESRTHDPIMILLGEGPHAVPTPFHRRKYEDPHGGWCWEAFDDQGRRVRSGVVHEEDSVEADNEDEEELNAAGFPD